ncbi:MAG TPA: hypothetical protein VMR76_01880 [Candidatus Saccharimonadia bacterium]|nr:hypothetical protein [Candidatus Saccharimonadia bacterium]
MFVCVGQLSYWSGMVVAANLPTSPQSGSYGIAGTIRESPPTTAATISTPTNNQSFTNLPITISGTCQSGLLIKIYINNVFSGASDCNNNSYSVSSDLFSGTNLLVAKDYDSLNQEGPDSNTVTVTYTNLLNPAGPSITLTSNFAKIGVNPGSVLSWPIQITGGSPPYAMSIDWGDNQQSTLLSKLSPGGFNITHTYAASGVYNIFIRATDSQNNVAVLQLVGVANGPISQSSNTSAKKSTTAKTATSLSSTVIIIILIVLLVTPITTFILGSKHQKKTIVSKLRNRQDPF